MSGIPLAHCSTFSRFFTVLCSNSQISVFAPSLPSLQIKSRYDFTMTSILRADTHVTDLIPFVPAKPLPFGIPETWSHMASTLISGDKEAILVDPPLTIKQGTELAVWIKETIPDKTLKTIFITHCHGDHYFSLSELLRHFPQVRAVATAAVVKHMSSQAEIETFSAFWEPSFPGQLERPAPGLVHALSQDNKIILEGHEMLAIEAGHSDADDSSFLYVPDLSLVVAGDICYNDMHQWLRDSPTEELRNAWIAALEKIASLKPATVIASHKRPGAVDGINNVYATMAYIRAFGEIKAKSKNAVELYRGMMERYPHRVNPLILWTACEGNFQQ